MGRRPLALDRPGIFPTWRVPLSLSFSTCKWGQEDIYLRL